MNRLFVLLALSICACKQEPFVAGEGCVDGDVVVAGICVPEACGIGRWGDIEVDEETLHVDAAAPAGGDGSAAAPFQAIQRAIDAVAERDGGKLVAVAAGIYAESLKLDKYATGIEVVGRCRELVVVDGGGGEEGSPAIMVDAKSSNEFRLSGLTVTGGRRAGVVLHGGVLQMSHSAIHSNQLGGMWVSDPVSHAELFDVVVSSSQPGVDGTGGSGVEVGREATFSASECQIIENYGTGILVYGDGSSADLNGVDIRGTRRAEGNPNGYGIQVSDSAKLTAAGGTIEGNSTAGVIAGE